jgi:hypothetical protein
MYLFIYEQFNRINMESKYITLIKKTYPGKEFAISDCFRVHSAGLFLSTA